MENVTKENAMYINEYLKKFKDTIETAETNYKRVEEFHKEVEKWVSAVNSIVSQSKLTGNAGFDSSPCTSFVCVSAEFGYHSNIKIFCLDNDKYAMNAGSKNHTWEISDLTKQELEQEVLSHMLKMLIETLGADLK